MPGFKQSAPDHGLRFAARPRSWFGTPGLRTGLRWIATTFAMAGSLSGDCLAMAPTPPQEYEVVLVLEEEPPAPHPQCKLSVCCWTVLVPELGPVAHCYTVCASSDPEAAPKGCRGGPAGAFDNERSQALRYSGCPVSSGAAAPMPPPNGDPCARATGTGIWGSIAAGCGRFEGKHPDFDRWFTKCTESDVDCDACACIERTMAHINCCCFRNEPLLLNQGYNSNSVVFTALNRCLPHSDDPPMPLLLDPIGWEEIGEHAHCPCHLTVPSLTESWCE